MTAEHAQIPAEFSSFVGRAGEVAELAELLPSVRALTLCGAGGIGKTRLALKLLATASADFPDGAWFVDLGELSRPELAVASIAAVVGVDEEPGRPLADTLVDAVRHRHALLVLDNCEHLIGACAALCQRLLANAPDLRVIATSREPMRVAAETVWQVPPLALPPADVSSSAELRTYDAVRLFAERAAAVAPGFSIGPDNAAAVARICRALDGLPLAIELAAAWVRALSVDQIAARISDRFMLLTGAGRGAPARQQTLRAAIDWSYDMLSSPEQILLRRLSVFAEWSLEMAEHVCADESLPAEHILDGVTALADKSLLEVSGEVLGRVRYRLLETVREYAGDWLSRAGEAEEFRRRRRDYTVREAEESVALGMAILPAPWSARVDMFRRFNAESENVHEVLAQCLATGDADTGLRICRAMTPVFIVRGNFSDCADWTDAFLALDAAATTPDAVRGPALAARAQLALASGSAAQAEELAQAALELCWAAGDQFYEGAALNLLTEAALHAGRLDDAEAKGSAALALARSGGDKWNEAYALGTMATVAGFRGNMREAQERAEGALAGMREAEHPWGTARALLGLADLARLQSDFGVARRYYQEALGHLRVLQSRPDTARSLAGLGRIAIEQGDLAAARRDLTESLQLSFASGSRIGMARGLEALARLFVLEGQPDTAVRLAGAIATLRQEAGMRPVPGARTQRILDAAAGLGQPAVSRLWADGAAMTPADAVRLAAGDGAVSVGPGSALPRVEPQSLTPREREVVKLIAAGKSNRAIGAELYISPATAARHVANILAKLGFTSRSQVAVWAKSADAARRAATAARWAAVAAELAGEPESEPGADGKPPEPGANPRPPGADPDGEQPEPGPS
jgi:predicted ATPase/DNA-binding CsgD family transcriptional regulator